MKTTTRILTTAAFAAALMLVTQARAHEPLASPRAKANQIKTVSGTTNEALDRSVKVGSPKGLQFQASLRKIAGTTTDTVDRDTAHLTPKLRELLGPRAKEILVAPLK